MLIAITTSAHRLDDVTGRLSTSPPSPSIWPLCRAAESVDMLPRRCTEEGAVEDGSCRRRIGGDGAKRVSSLSKLPMSSQRHVAVQQDLRFWPSVRRRQLDREIAEAERRNRVLRVLALRRTKLAPRRLIRGTRSERRDGRSISPADMPTRRATDGARAGRGQIVDRDAALPVP